MTEITSVMAKLLVKANGEKVRCSDCGNDRLWLWEENGIWKIACPDCQKIVTSAKDLEYKSGRRWKAPN